MRFLALTTLILLSVSAKAEWEQADFFSCVDGLIAGDASPHLDEDELSDFIDEINTQVTQLQYTVNEQTQEVELVPTLTNLRLRERILDRLGQRLTALGVNYDHVDRVEPKSPVALPTRLVISAEGHSTLNRFQRRLQRRFGVSLIVMVEAWRSTKAVYLPVEPAIALDVRSVLAGEISVSAIHEYRHLIGDFVYGRNPRGRSQLLDWFVPMAKGGVLPGSGNEDFYSKGFTLEEISTYDHDLILELRALGARPHSAAQIQLRMHLIQQIASQLGQMLTMAEVSLERVRGDLARVHFNNGVASEFSAALRQWAQSFGDGRYWTLPAPTSIATPTKGDVLFLQSIPNGRFNPGMSDAEVLLESRRRVSELRRLFQELKPMSQRVEFTVQEFLNARTESARVAALKAARDLEVRLNSAWFSYSEN